VLKYGGVSSTPKLPTPTPKLASVLERKTPGKPPVVTSKVDPAAAETP
jgi:hypothetical protein